MKNAIIKDTFREIRKTRNRFISIAAIVALGTGFFCGIKITCPDMLETADQYYNNTKLADFHLLSPLGITSDDVDKIKELYGILGVMPSYSQEVFLSDDPNNAILRLMSLPKDKSANNVNYLNRPVLIEGRLPEDKNECAVERRIMSNDAFKLGNTISFNSGKDDFVEENLTTDRCEIVGIVQSPQFISFERGSASIGNGQLSNFVLVDESMFDFDVYTDLYLQVDTLRNTSAFSDKYENLSESFLNVLEDLGEIQSVIRYSDVYNEAMVKINDAQILLDEKEAEAKDKLSDASRTINKAQRDIDDAKITLANEVNKANKEIADAQKELYDGQEEYDQKYVDYLQEITDAEAEIVDNELKIEKGIKELNDGYAAYLDAYDSSKAQLEAGQKVVDYLRSVLAIGNLDSIKDIGYSTIEALASDIKVQQATIDAGWSALESARDKLDQAEIKLLDGKKEIEKAKIDLEQAKIDAEIEFGDAQDEINEGYQKIADAKVTLERETTNANKKIKDGERDLSSGRVEYNDAKNEADTKIGDAKIELADARAEVKKLEESEWYVFDRTNQPGYGDYQTDADRVDKIAAVFPVFFIIVAMLICLTTMTRMVEEQRGQIGTLKALGYSNQTILSKYLLYALFASVIGCTIGLLVGFSTLPVIIFDAYRMMYILPKLLTPFDWTLAIGSMVVSIVCTCFAAYIAGRKELYSEPSQLMRPKTPKAGKKVFLEYIPAIWNHISFAYKITIRNIARYKSRIILTVVGIGGCTALMLTGFGIRDSISSIVDRQFNEIFIYDLVGALEDNLTSTEVKSVEETLLNTELLSESMLVYNKNIDIKINNIKRNVTLFVPSEPEHIEKFITYKERVSQKPLSISDDGVIITEKFAKILKVKVGDTFVISENGINADLLVRGICENYTMNYIYMTPTYYNALFKQIPINNVFIGNITEFNEENQSLVATQLIENDSIIGISYISETGKKFSNVMESLNIIVYVLIICSGALAFIVLYNLTNINVNERLRELATIKVLGFFDGEVSAYIYRENVFSSVLGIIVGLYAGIYLHAFVVQTAEVEVVMFDPTIKTLSYVIAGLLTLLFTFLVNFALHFKLKKIDMVESLKSVE